MSAEDTRIFGELNFFQTLFSAMTALGLLKISIAFFLLQLSTSKWYSRSLWGLVGFVVLYTIFAWLTLLLHCQPVDGFWNKTMVPKPKCYDILLFIKFGMANTGMSMNQGTWVV